MMIDYGGKSGRGPEVENNIFFSPRWEVIGLFGSVCEGEEVGGFVMVGGWSGSSRWSGRVGWVDRWGKMRRRGGSGSGFLLNVVSMFLLCKVGKYVHGRRCM